MVHARQNFNQTSQRQLSFFVLENLFQNSLSVVVVVMINGSRVNNRTSVCSCCFRCRIIAVVDRTSDTSFALIINDSPTLEKLLDFQRNHL